MSKILAVRLSSLGDVVLAQPAVTALAQAGHTVEFLTKPAYSALAAMFPGVACVAVSPEDLASDYDLVLDWHATLRARSWIRGLKKVKTVRYAKHALERRLLIRPHGRPMFWNSWPALSPDASVTAWYGQAARQAGLTLELPAPGLVIPESARQAARDLLAHAGLAPTEPWVAMAPGAKWPTKRWPVAAFAELAVKLKKEFGWRSVFLGAAADGAFCREAGVLAGPPAVSLAGETSLPVLAALLAAARLLVSNDSGPMHLGVAAGARVLAFFGPTVREFGFAPQVSPLVRVLSRDLPCRPCSLHGSRRCPLGHHDCLKKITAEEAFHVSRELLR